MSTQAMSVLIILLQGVIVALLLVVVRRFGVWTRTVVEAHRSNVVFYRQAIKILEYAEELLKQEPAA